MPADLALPDTEAIVTGQPRLPGLAVVLTPKLLAECVKPLVGDQPYAISRLRLKTDTSLAASVRPVAGPGRWLLLRAYAPGHPGAKADKDTLWAGRHHLPVVEYPQHRMVLTVAAADRHLNLIRALRPQLRRSPGHPADLGGVATLSYNPFRRWVGAERDELGRPRWILRLETGSRRPLRTPWIPGRQWEDSDDPELLLRALRCGITHHLEQHGPSTPRHDLPHAMERAAHWFLSLHPPWGERLVRLLPGLVDRVANIPLAPAHGDLSADQVVVGTDGQVHVLDWDRFGRWPQGWDVASWRAAAIANGNVAVAPLGPCQPVVAAAAALLRSPEPFRRQYPQWPQRTEELVRAAERDTR